MPRTGIEWLRATYSKEFEVELEPTMPDGKPWAVKLRQVRPLVLLAVGESIPVSAEGNGGGSTPRFGKGELVKKYKGFREVVTLAVSAVRNPVENEDGTWVDGWTPVTVVCDRPAEAGEMHIDEIDLPKTQNIVRCWNALFADAQSIERRAGFEDASFREEGPVDAGGDVETLWPAAPRVGTRKAGSRRG